MDPFESGVFVRVPHKAIIGVVDGFLGAPVTSETDTVQRVRRIPAKEWNVDMSGDVNGLLGHGVMVY